MRLNILIILLLLISQMAFGQEQNLIPFFEQDKWGYLDNNNTIVIPTKFDTAYVFTRELAIIKIDGKYGVINSKGNYLIKPKNHLIINNHHNKFFEIQKQKNSQIHCIDYYGNKTECFHQVYCGMRTTNRLIPSQRTSYIQKEDKYALVFLNREYNGSPSKLPNSYLDSTEYVFTSIQEYGESLYIVQKDNLYGIFDPFETQPDLRCEIELITEQEEYHDQAVDNLNKYRIMNNWGLINYKGVRITKPIYKEIYFTEDKNLALVKTLNDTFYYIDFTGKKYMREE